LLCQQLFSNRVFDVITGEASLAGLKSLARIMLLCAVYPSMISRAFLDIYSVVFLITIVLPVSDFISCYQLTFKISQLKKKIVSSHLKPPFEDLYPSLPSEVAQLKVHFSQAFFHGIFILQSDVGKPLIFSPSRFRLCSICSDPSINENI
jgi:hypothetical protein